MKKYLMILCLMGILTGCGFVDGPNANLSEAATKPRITEPVTEAPTTSTEAVTETTTKASKASGSKNSKSTDTKTKSTESTNETKSTKATKTPPKATEPITEEPQISLRDSVVAEYSSALQSKIDLVHLYYPNNMYLTYALFDMDKDGVPELLVNYGTCEADRQIAIYTYRDGQLMRLADSIVGSHTNFAYDYVADQLVLAQGHMGYGDMSWYDLDENGELRALIKTDTLDYSSDDKPTYEDYMVQYNVAWLDSSEFYQMDHNNEVTWVSVYSSGDREVLEYDGYVFYLLENIDIKEK